MSGLPSRPEVGSPTRSPERDRDDRYPRGYSRRHSSDMGPPYESPYRGGGGGGYDASWDGRGRGEMDDRWSDEYDRKRRRSPSPSYSNARPRHRSPSPPSRYHGGGPGGGGGHTLPDPASLEYLLNFRQFAEWFRQSHPQTARSDDEELRRIRNDVENGVLPESVLIEKHGMAKRYERYRKEYTSRQLFSIYLTHRDEAWFEERYSPDASDVALRRRVNRQGRVPTVKQYVDELRQGKWDDVNYDQTEDKMAPRMEEPEGLDRALGDDYDPLRIEVPPRPGQVFVKTVPPSTRRKDLEGVFAKHPGFQWLALSEPSAKKAFHRVGWAQYAEGVNVDDAVSTIDGSRIDNFTFHMGVNGTPIIGRIRVAPAVTNSLERLETDASRARDLARALEEDLLDEAGSTPDEEKKEGDEESKEDGKDTSPGLRERGTDAVNDVVARLLARESLDGEDLDDNQRVRKAKITLDQYLSYIRHGLNSCYYCVVPTAFPEELQRKCVGHLRAQPEPLVAEPVAEDSGRGEGAEDKAEGEEQRDENNDAEESRGAEEHPRRESTSNSKDDSRNKKFQYPSKSNDEKWLDNLDLRVRAIVEDDVDVVDYGGRDVEDETRRLTAPQIKQEEADKYRCKQCSKLFRAPEFVIKHIIGKHAEVVKDKLNDIHVFNNFVLDPQHIQPSANTPAAIDDQLPPPGPGNLPAFNPSKATQAMFTAAAANQPGFNMAMQQQMMMMMHMQMMMQGNNQGGSGSGEGGAGGPASGAAGAPGMPSGNGAGKGPARDFDAAGLPPAPPGGEDPRARKGRVSYRDLDEAGGGDGGGLPY